ncbi:chitinase domain-containing protein 1-like isoform X2 [Pomacea canaliculata]|uniref:chitinase domain-containing protein 1-like isoform X2 n=1 Tax=Pomacea canaliculata TaxID=400727 RepID=UPI000D72FB63|nr:chitinase domain-containing protein 1-like isoform X2 [Pomacea canaliculata]
MKTDIASGLIMFVMVLALGSLVSGTLSKSDKTKNKKRDSQKVVLSVVDRGLVTAEVKRKHILEEHSRFSPLIQDVKNFKGPVLGYVTPWNNHGYDVAKMFAHKFTLISPVWLQLKKKPNGVFVIEGSHDIDKGWINEVQSGKNVSIVPRVLFDGWGLADFSALFSSEDAIEDCIDTLVNFLKGKKFDGATIEIWPQVGGNMRSELTHFLLHLGEALHKQKKILVLVIPPPVRSGTEGIFGRQDFENLRSAVDYFSLMTYDYSSRRMPGPNSPIQWVQECVEILSPTWDPEERKKILAGLNFYGTYYIVGSKVEPILGSQYVDLLQKQKVNIAWDPANAEHVTEFGTAQGQHVIYYPSLYSIQQRLELASKFGIGISIWELGQGLDYFYDLF